MNPGKIKPAEPSRRQFLSLGGLTVCGLKLSFLRAVSCDFVDRPPVAKKLDPRIHTKNHEPKKSSF